MQLEPQINIKKNVNMFLHKGDGSTIIFLPNFYSWGVSLDHFYWQVKDLGQSSQL